MSHFTEIKTEIKDIETLKKALKALNMEFEHNEAGCDIRGFYGDIIKGDVKISTGTEYDLGLRMTSEGSYEFVADWEMLKYKEFDAENMRGKIMQRYSYEKVKHSLEEQGYEFEEESVDENGNIQMVVSQW